MKSTGLHCIALPREWAYVYDKAHTYGVSFVSGRVADAVIQHPVLYFVFLIR